MAELSAVEIAAARSKWLVFFPVSCKLVASSIRSALCAVTVLRREGSRLICLCRRARKGPLHLPLRAWFVLFPAAVVFPFSGFVPLAHGQAIANRTKAAPVPPLVLDGTRMGEPLGVIAMARVHAGDDPDGKLGWARPDFDDSKWDNFDPGKSLYDFYGTIKTQVVWYRLRVKVDPAQKDLSLDEYYLAHAFEVFANGEKVLASGRVASYLPYTVSA
jgi:hypothetical protein